MSNTLQIKRRTSGSGALGSLAVGELGVDLTDSNKLYVGSSSGNQLLNPSASTSYLPLAGGDLTGTLNIGNTGDEKIVLKNSNNPYVMFQQGTTNKGFIQWNAAYAFLEIANSAESTNLRLDDTLQLSLDGGSYYDVLTSNTGLLKTGGTLTGDLTIAHDSTPTLLLRANTVDSANSGKISFRENSGGTTGADIRYNGATNKLIFDTSDVSNALVLDRVTGALTVGSNLGINGSSATDPLSVKGESANDYVARFYRSDNGNTLVDVFQDSSNHGHLFVRNSAGLTKVKLFSDGVSYFRGGNLEVDTRTDSNNASAEFTVRSDVHASVVADRNANTNSANFMLRTAGVNKWRMSLGMAGSGNETFSIYDEANTANVLTIAQGGATTFSGTVMLTSGAILTNHSSNNNYGFQIKSADNTQSALELRDNNNNWKATFYGATSAYGFLDGPWGNWDIRKAVDGVLQIDQGSGLETVLTNATGLQLTGGTLTGDLKIDRTTNASSPLLQIENDANHVLQLGVVRSAAGTGPNTGIVNYPTAGLRIIKGTGTDEKARFDSDGALLINTTSKGSNTAGKLYIGSPLADSAALAQINGLVRLQYLITHASGTGASDHSGLQPNTNNTGNVGNTSFRYYGAYFNVGDFSGNLTVGGSLYLTDTNTRLHEGGDNSLRITTNSGYVDIGPMNSSFSHFQTDRGQFYFNKQLNVDGHVLPYSNNTYYSGLSTNRWANVYSVAGDFSGTVSIGSHLTHSGYVQYKNGSTNSGIIGSSSLVAANTTPASDLAIRSSGALRFIVSDNWASPKFELAASTGNATFSGNLTVSGTSTFHGSLDLQDNDKLLLGAGNDLEIYHDGSHSYVSDVGTGHLRLTGTNVLIEDGSGTDYIYAASDAVTLYNAGNIKLQTTSAGVSITGNLTVSGTISAGSNADTLDNLDSTQFLRSDANDTTTGRLTIANTSGADGLVIAGGENTGLSARLFFETGTGGQGVSLLNIGGILDFRTGATAGSSSGTQRMQMSTSGLYPFTDAAFTLGTSAKKWSVIYGDKVRVDSHTTMGAASSDSANMSNAAILVGTTGTGIGIDSNEITGVGGTMYINSLHNNGIRFYAGTAGASTNVQVARFENDLVRFYQPVELDSNLKLAGDSASRISFGSKIAIEGQISNNNLDLGESFANIRLRSSADVFPTASVNLGTSSNRWSTIYGAAGNFSGTVTATAFSGTADKSDMVTGSAFATTGSPSSVLEYQQAASVTDTKLAPTSDWYNTIRMGHGNPYSYYSNTIAVQMTGTGAGQIRTQLISNNNAQGWRTVWDDANDGAGSGLDADLLDGQHGSHYLAAANLTGTPPNTFIYGDDTLGAFASSTFAVNPPRMGFFNINNSSTENPDGSSYWQGLHFRHNNQTSTWGWQLTGTYNTSYDSLFFRQITNGTRGSWNRIWSSNNDGSGSGLDADKLDGLQATSFLRSDADDTTTGNLTVGGTLAFNSGTFSGETDLGLTGADHTLYSGEGDNELRFGRSSAECMRFYVNDYHAYFDLIQDADSNQDHYVYFRNQASGTGARGFKFEGGPVGINTIPNAASYLHVNGWSIFESGSSLVSVRLKSSAGEWDIDNNNGTFGLQWAGGDKLTLSNSGNLTVGGTLDVNGSGQQMASFGNTSARCGIEVKSSQWCEVFFTNSSYANSARIGMAYDSSHSSGTVNGDWYVYQPNVSTMDLIVKRAGGVTLCSSGHTTTVGGSLTVTKSLLGVSNSGLSKIGNIVLDTNGEDLPVINHQLNNDLALMDVKGGTVTYGGLSSTPSTGGTGNVFESDSTFLSIYRSDQTSSNPRISNASDGFTITLESLPKNLSYTTRVGITFAHSGWRCSYVKIEVYRAGAWTQIREETNNTGATVYQYYNTAGSAISKIRYTLKNPATTYLRIVSLFAFNYNSYGNSGYFLSQAGGTIYGSATVNSNLTVAGSCTFAALSGTTANFSGQLEVGNDGNTDYALIGPTKIGGGFGHGDYAGFSHRDRSTTTSYALLQHTGGTTYLNSNVRIYMGVNNANYTAQVESDRFQVNNALKLNDNSKIKIGSSDDLEIYHDGTNSYIDNNTGQLFLNKDGPSNVWLCGGEGGILNADGSEYMVRATNNGSVKLYYDNAIKFETASTGATVTGNLSVIYNGSASVRTYNGVLKSDFLENSAGANHLTIRTESGGNKNVIIDPDGTGITQIYGNLSVSGNGVVKQIVSNAYATADLNNWYTGGTATFGQFYRYDSTHGHFQDAAGNVAANAPNTLTQSPTQIYSYGALLTLGTTNDFRGQFYMAHSASEIYYRSGWGSSGDQNWTRLVGDRNIQSVINNVGNISIGGAPSAVGKLTIHTGTNTNGLLIYEDTDDSITHNLYIDSNDQGVMQLRNNSNASTVQLHSGGDSFFTGGSLCIGTVTPSGTYTKLHVVGTTFIDATETTGGLTVKATSNANITLQNAQNTAYNAVLAAHYNWTTPMTLSGYGATVLAMNSGIQKTLLYANNAERVRITATGTGIGLGGSDPATTLEVSGTIRSTAFLPKIQLKRTGNVVANGDIEWLGSDDSVDWSIRANYDSGGDNFNIKEGSTSRFYIKSGKVGLGGTPSSPLTLHMTGGSYNTDATSGFIISNTSSGRATQRIRTVNDNAAELFLDVNGAARWDFSCRASHQNYDLRIYNQASSPSYTAVAGPVMTLQQSGNVAIGGATAHKKLHIIDDSDPTIRITNTDGGTNDTAAFELGVSSNTAIASTRIEARRQSDGSVDLNFRGAGTTSVAQTAAQMTLDGGTGYFGISTTAPYNHLHVNGNGRINSLIVGNSAANNTPAAALHIKSSGTAAVLRIEDSDSSNQVYDFLCNQGSGLSIVDKGTGSSTNTRLHISTNGHIGINNGSPSRPLQIGDGSSGNVDANGDAIYLRGDTSLGAFIQYVRGGQYNWRAGISSGSYFHINDVSQSNATRLSIAHTTGYVQVHQRLGIGTAAPDNPLEVVGADSGIKISSASNNRPHLRLECGTAEKLRLSANTLYGAIGDSSDTNRYMAFKDGNVSVNTVSPTSKFHVVGASTVATTKAEMNSKSVMKLHHNNPSTTSTNMQLAGVGGGMGLQVTNYNDTANWDIYLNPFGGNVMIGSNRDPNGLLELRSDNSPRMILGYHTGTNAHRIYWDSSKLYLSADHEGDVDNSELRFLVDGSLKAQILSDGRFGIGASPSYTFDVYKSVTGNWLSRIYNTATSGNSSGLLVRMDEPGSTGIAFGVYANGGYKFRVEPDGETQILSGSAYTTHLNYQNTGSHYISTGNSGFTIFRGASNGVTAMRVNGDGKVSINSGSNNGYNLYVNGTSYFNSGSTQNPATLYTSQSTGGNYLLFNNASGQLGYVGWGSTGNNDLYIVNQGGSNTGAIRLYAGGSTKVLVASDGDTDITGRLGVGGNHSGSYGLYVHGTSYFGNNIYGADADYLAVFGRARVGYIGWTDYAGFAHRDQAAQTTYALLQDENGSTFLNSASGQSIYFRQANSNVGGIVSGNWGLGTISPGSYKLYVNGTTYLGGNSVLNGDLFFGSTSGSVITTSSGVLRHLGDNGVKLETYSGGWQERLVIADDGDIDIAQKLGVGGSHSNSYALYVTGDTKITGNFRAESYIWAKGGIKDDGGDHGTDGQVLSTDGSGAVHWVDQSSGSGSGTVNSGTAEQMAFYASNGTAVSGTSAFTFENSTDEEFNIGNGSSKGELCIGGGVGETSADYRLFVNGGIKFDEELCSESGIIKFQSNSSGTETTEMIMSSSGLTVNNSSSQTDSTYALYVSGGIKNSTGGLYVTGDGYISSRLGVATSVDTSYGIKVAGYIASYGHTTWSDYRLKDNTTLWNTSEAATLVKDVPVYSYRWNDNCEAKSVQDQDRIGFLAHEVSEKINKNNLVINEKDGEKYQSVNQTDMIPILWAALQDALKRIEELEAKL